MEKALSHLINFTLQVYGLHLSYRVDQRNAGNGPQVNAAGQNAVQAQPAAGNAAGGGGAALGFQPYIRPRMFAFKVNTSPTLPLQHNYYIFVFLSISSLFKILAS